MASPGGGHQRVCIYSRRPLHFYTYSEAAYLKGSSWIVVDGTVAEMQMKYAMKTPTID